MPLSNLEEDKTKHNDDAQDNFAKATTLINTTEYKKIM